MTSGASADRPSHAGRLARLRERGVLEAALLGLAAGLAAGFAAFWVASSRGLDELGLADAIAALGAIVVLVLVVGAIARALWADDLRLAALAVALIAGAWAGSNVAFYALPGNTTDGTMGVLIGRAQAPAEVAAVCAWDEAARTVVAVDSRRQFVALPHVAVNARVELDAGASARMVIEALLPVTFEPVLRLHGSGQPSLGDENARMGTLSARDLGREGPPEDGVDPVLAEFVIEQLDAMGANEQSSFSWECPRLP